MFYVLGFQDDESFEEYFVDETVVNESCKRVDKVVTLKIKILVSPLLKLTATESNSDLIRVVSDTCPLNWSH